MSDMVVIVLGIFSLGAFGTVTAISWMTIRFMHQRNRDQKELIGQTISQLVGSLQARSPSEATAEAVRAYGDHTYLDTVIGGGEPTQPEEPTATEEGGPISFQLSSGGATVDMISSSDDLPEALKGGAAS